MPLWKSLALPTFVCFICYVVKGVYDLLGYYKQIDYNDDTCKLLETPTAVEDLASFGDGHSVIGGGGDIWNAFQYGSASAKDGAFWLINGTSGEIHKFQIVGNTLPKLIPHGIYFSQTSHRLYAVNHDEKVGDSVEVFELSNTQSLELRHLASVTSPLFNNMALNDVVEGIDGEIYITEWLPFSIPQGGKKNPAMSPTWIDFLGKLLTPPINLLKIPTTRVFRCTLDGAPKCLTASSQRFVMANGITISQDRQTIFVSDPTGKEITALRRQVDGMLKTISKFVPKHMLDNIEMSSEGVLQGGSIPLGFTSDSACEEGLGVTKDIGGRTVGCGVSPGGLMQISLLGKGSNPFKGANQRDVLMHDGSKLSGVSSALKVGADKVVIGSPSSPGVLICTI